MFADIHRCLAFGCGSGWLKPASGTWGTVFGALISVPFVEYLPVWLQIVVLVLAYGYGIYICQRVSQELGVHDHGGIVWDEIVAIAFVYALMPLQNIWFFILGFLFFRIFDVIKPFPIRQIDAKLHSGQAIMLDDLLAGIYTLIVLYLIKYFCL
ncbi:hypothetical protein IX83_03475 [Basilea psittacipulmonis DSM 24701]|uniref:Phosphatidylglycerophosphatase A n=1 Tax=Basilea psittacipulmonis DSM 24701 TaxID=1072685 RepID=A0A077DD02_9BURK|nr:hypothetical protein IX83_03475 [Basilea psittacipulmonis DSM 24701]